MQEISLIVIQLKICSTLPENADPGSKAVGPESRVSYPEDRTEGPKDRAVNHRGLGPGLET